MELDDRVARRGGIHQRLAGETRTLSRNVSSELADYLLTEFSWGRMSPQQVQKIASLAMNDIERASRDSVVFNDLHMLQRIGDSGRHSNNAYRDLMNHLEKIPGLVPVSQVALPTKVGDAEADLILPHVLFAHLYETNRPRFLQLFLPEGTDSLKRFWTQCRNLPSLQGTPAKQTLNPQCAIPIGLHGDEVPVAGRGKCYCKFCVVWTWFSLVSGMLPTKENLNLIWSCNPQQFVPGPLGTLDIFWKVIAWSLSILETGRWPERDWRNIAYPPGTVDYARAGKLIANGFYCVMVALVGDLDYTNKFLSMPHWASASRLCNLCLCTASGDQSWKDFRSVAPWRTTVFSVARWRADPGRANCALFTIPSCSGLSVQPDMMHVKYLGYLQYFLGSVLFMLTHRMMPGSAIDNLRRIGVMVRRLQKERFTCTSRFPMAAWNRLSIFLRKKGFPKLRGKAGVIQGVVGPIEFIWQRYMSQDNLVHRRIALIFQLDREIEKALREYCPSNGYYAVPPAVGNQIKTKQIQLSQLMVQLEDTFATDTRKLFNTVSKLHYMAHIADSASHLHPFVTWCFKGEDFMNTASVLISSCLRGRSDVGATVKAIRKYRFAMHQTWKN